MINLRGARYSGASSNWCLAFGVAEVLRIPGGRGLGWGLLNFDQHALVNLDQHADRTS